MGYPVQVSLEIPDDLADFHLPDSVQRRLQTLLDLQDSGKALTPHEHQEAEALVCTVDILRLLRLRTDPANPLLR